jgi:hypothetical protein
VALFSETHLKPHESFFYSKLSLLSNRPPPGQKRRNWPVSCPCTGPVTLDLLAAGGTSTGSWRASGRGSCEAPPRSAAAGVFLTAARWLRAVDAGESPYGGGETDEAGAGTGVRKHAWFSGPEKGRFWRSRVFRAVRVGGESADDSSPGSRTTAPGLSVGSVGGLRWVALLCAVSRESVLSTQVGPTVYGA